MKVEHCKLFFYVIYGSEGRSTTMEHVGYYIFVDMYYYGLDTSLLCEKHCVS